MLEEFNLQLIVSFLQKLIMEQIFLADDQQNRQQEIYFQPLQQQTSSQSSQEFEYTAQVKANIIAAQLVPQYIRNINQNVIRARLNQGQNLGVQLIDLDIFLNGANFVKNSELFNAIFQVLRDCPKQQYQQVQAWRIFLMMNKEAPPQSYVKIVDFIRKEFGLSRHDIVDQRIQTQMQSAIQRYQANNQKLAKLQGIYGQFAANNRHLSEKLDFISQMSSQIQDFIDKEDEKREIARIQGFDYKEYIEQQKAIYRAAGQSLQQTVQQMCAKFYMPSKIDQIKHLIHQGNISQIYKKYSFTVQNKTEFIDYLNDIQTRWGQTLQLFKVITSARFVYASLIEQGAVGFVSQADFVNLVTRVVSGEADADQVKRQVKFMVGQYKQFQVYAKLVDKAVQKITGIKTFVQKQPVPKQQKVLQQILQATQEYIKQHRQVAVQLQLITQQEYSQTQPQLKQKLVQAKQVAAAASQTMQRTIQQIVQQIPLDKNKITKQNVVQMTAIILIQKKLVELKNKNTLAAFLNAYFGPFINPPKQKPIQTFFQKNQYQNSQRFRKSFVHLINDFDRRIKKVEDAIVAYAQHSPSQKAKKTFVDRFTATVEKYNGIIELKKTIKDQQVQNALQRLIKGTNQLQQIYEQVNKNKKIGQQEAGKTTTYTS